MYTRNSDSEKDRDRQTERRSHTGRQGQKQKQSANRQIDIEESIALKKIFRDSPFDNNTKESKY